MTPRCQPLPRARHCHATSTSGGRCRKCACSGHPKQPTDEDAVQYVTCQRHCVTQAAADSQILLPITSSSDQASTAAPADDEPSPFGREEALRLDEEIINFQWFDSIKEIGGTKDVQPPPRFRFAFQQDQYAMLRAIVYPGPSSPASESAWKVLVLSSWLLLGRPAINASESNCAHFLDARLNLFWSEDRAAAEQKQSRVRKVATPAPSGKRGRALACRRPDDSCCRILQPQTLQVLFWHAPNKRAAGQICGKPVDADQPTTVVGADVEVVLIAGMLQWPDALQM